MPLDFSEIAELNAGNVERTNTSAVSRMCKPRTRVGKRMVLERKAHVGREVDSAKDEEIKPGRSGSDAEASFKTTCRFDKRRKPDTWNPAQKFVGPPHLLRGLDFRKHEHTSAGRRILTPINAKLEPEFHQG